MTKNINNVRLYDYTGFPVGHKLENYGSEFAFHFIDPSEKYYDRVTGSELRPFFEKNTRNYTFTYGSDITGALMDIAFGTDAGHCHYGGIVMGSLNHNWKELGYIKFFHVPTANHGTDVIIYGIDLTADERCHMHSLAQTSGYVIMNFNDRVDAIVIPMAQAAYMLNETVGTFREKTSMNFLNTVVKRSA